MWFCLWWSPFSREQSRQMWPFSIVNFWMREQKVYCSNYAEYQQNADNFDFRTPHLATQMSHTTRANIIRTKEALISATSALSVSRNQPITFLPRGPDWLHSFALPRAFHCFSPVPSVHPRYILSFFLENIRYVFTAGTNHVICLLQKIVLKLLFSEWICKLAHTR